MHFKRRSGKKVFVSNTLTALFPDKKVKLADMASQLRRENYSDLPPIEGREKAYRRICSDFANGVCIRKWGRKEGYQLVELDGPDGWVYLGWVLDSEVQPDISN
jgi:hypothetical protein